MLTKDIVSFEQLSPGMQFQWLSGDSEPKLCLILALFLNR